MKKGTFKEMPIESMIEDFNNGMGIPQIALKYDLAYPSVNRRLKQLGYSRGLSGGIKLSFMNGRVAPNTGLNTDNCERIKIAGRKISAIKKGKETHTKGKKNKYLSERNKIDNPYYKFTDQQKEVHRERARQMFTALWANPEYRARMVEKRKANSLNAVRSMRQGQFTCPNRPETIMINLIIKYNLPYRFVGDGSVMIGHKNPDFINIDHTKIIEVFGEFWHRDYHSVVWHRTETGCIKFYQNKGIACLIIWVEELSDSSNHAAIIERIKIF